jgi:predicted transposase YdaD
MSHHDHSYKLLFSHPEMVRDLMLGFVREAWVTELDFATLERVNTSYISEDLRRREDDIIWRVRRNRPRCGGPLRCG